MLASKSIYFLLPVLSLANPFGIRAASSPSTCQPGKQVIANRDCTVECGTDYPGGDYKSVKVANFQACINACAADLICKDAQYHQANGYCYLKKDLNKSKAAADVDSVVCACPKPVTSTQTSISTITPTSATEYTSTTVVETAATNTITESTTTTETTTTTFQEVATEYTVSTVSETSTSTTTTQLSCLSTAYLAADHPATVAQAQIAKRATTTTAAAQCTVPPAITTTVTQFTTLPQGTITITNTITNTYVPTTTTTKTFTETSTASTTTTNTVTSASSTTTTTNVVAATATALTPGNLDYRLYNSPYSYADNPPRFNAGYFKTAAVRSTGKLNDMSFGGISAGTALVVQGFFIAPQTGTYRFDSGYDAYVDEWDWLWVGDAAYSWTDSNANYKASGYQSSNGNGNSNFSPASTTFTANAGDAIPMTLLTSNSGGPGSSQVSAVFPDKARHASNLREYWIPACDRAATFQ